MSFNTALTGLQAATADLECEIETISPISIPFGLRVFQLRQEFGDVYAPVNLWKQQYCYRVRVWSK